MTTSLFISVLLALLQSELVKDKVLKPSAVVFKYSNITSVAALRSNSWIVLFFGTGTGLLIMLGIHFDTSRGNLNGQNVIFHEKQEKVHSENIY